MSAYQPYPKYKPSGVAWLGDVPEDWEVKPLKVVASFNDDVLPETFGEDVEIEYVDIGSVSLETGIERTETFRFGDAPSRARRRVRDGDVIASTVRTYLKAIAPVIAPSANLIVSTGFAVIRPRNGLDSHFAKFSLQSAYFVDEVISRSTGVSYPAINASEMAAISLALPPLPEQRQIAAFLDRECGKLDALQAKQERLIELLKEMRQALISHAVTKGLPGVASAKTGLDPAVKLKPSGIEWLGDVPEHWNIEKLWWHFGAEKGKDSQRLTKEFCIDNPGEFPVYSGQTANEGVMGLIDHYDYDEGARGVLFATTVGAKAMELKHLTHKFSLSQNCMIIRPRHSRFDVRFYLHHFTPLFYFERQMIPDHMQPSFRVEDLLSYRIAIPPLAEQRAIVAHLDEKCGKLDLLKAKAERAIELLKERRSALISAAVTGKIDVRTD